ncbi:hypothetical protein PT974_05344 [Cladobotryum mycophilum]|uniref:C6 finger domain protein n=1 Tax=Cladobotryum mycophilum TaxID=491253 RepID=A0ABR0SJK5_9HYPO
MIRAAQQLPDCEDELRYWTPQGVLEYLPLLLRLETHAGTLSNIVSAAGLVALSNAGASTPWKYEAYRLYGDAIRQLQTDLQDEARMKSDSTLASIMLMSTFEIIASAKPASMDTFSRHIVAAARCVEIRGPSQFRSAVSAILFTELRRLIAMTCHQLQEPMPYAVKRWSQWVEPIQKNDEAALNRFAELNEHLAAVRASIKQEGIRNPATVATMLYPIDCMLEDWKKGLPDSWSPKSYRLLSTEVNPLKGYEHQYDVYRDLWVASTWNNYRMVRIVIHESVIIATMAYGLGKEKEGELNHSAKTLTEMANAICHSVPYILGYRHGTLHAVGTGLEASGPYQIPRPGGYLLLWPLFIAGSLRTTSQAQKRWIVSTLRDIGLRMGLQLAMSMATKLEDTAASFSASMMWFIGEFFPG